MPSLLRRTARTVARTSSECASTGGGGLTWASTAALSQSPLPACRPGACAGTRADSVPPAGQSCRGAATHPPPVPRRAGTAAVPREQAGLSAPRQDSAVRTAATSAYAFLTSAVRYCTGPGAWHAVQPQDTPQRRFVDIAPLPP